MRKIFMKCAVIFITAIFIPAMPALLCSCSIKHVLPDREEIDQLEFVTAIGLDKPQNDSGNIRFTVTSQKKTPQGGDVSGSELSSESVNSTVLVESEVGKTVFEAARKLQIYSEKQIFWGHVRYAFIGEDAAKEGLVKYVDLISRGQEMRLNMNVFIVKGGLAEDLLMISKTSEIYVPKILDNLLRTLGFNSVSRKLQLLELMQHLDESYSSVCVPVASIKEGVRNRKSEEVSGESTVQLKGFALFKGSKLAAYTNDSETFGINFFNNDVTSRTFNVKDRSGKEVSLEIIETDCKIIPVFSGNDLSSVRVQAFVRSNIAEEHSTMNIYDGESLENLSQQLADIIRQDLLNTVKISQKYGIDCLNIGNTILHKHPIRFDAIKDKWEEIFPALDFDITVQSDIQNTYGIKEPNNYNAGEQ